jgi:uncharacterized protein YcfJ
MLKSVALACACSLAVPLTARAAEAGPIRVTTTPRETFSQQVYEVQERRSAGSIILTDAIGGAALGALAGGGVAAYRNFVKDEGWGNWQRDVLIGAGIGLGVGLILGVATAASADRTFNGPIADQRPTGFSSSVPVYGSRF